MLKVEHNFPRSVNTKHTLLSSPTEKKQQQANIPIQLLTVNFNDKITSVRRVHP